MPDPNARRDKALESIAAELKMMNAHLRLIERNTRRKPMIVTNYLEKNDDVRNDGSDHPVLHDDGAGAPSQ